jgi:NAD(P)-dependent dehydrogenase (short-subunit alcohol dehydrogenase family)
VSNAIDLSDRVIIVTGASRGIGKGLAIGLAALGANVVCAARSVAAQPGDIPGTIDETVAAINDNAGRGVGGAAIAIRCDIGVAEDITALVDATVEHFGGLDVLVNNAMAPTQSLFDESTVEQWDESMRVNVRSLYLFARAVVPIMAARGGGSIVNISSHGADHATTPFMPPGYLFYTVAKAALERFSSSLAPEVLPLGIVVNALRPGAVKTEMTELEYGPDHDWSGWTTPDDVVAPVAALAACAGTDFTGNVIDVGGFGKTWGRAGSL